MTAQQDSHLVSLIIEANAQKYGDAPAFLGSANDATYSELQKQATRFKQHWASLSGARVGLALQPEALSVAMLVALDSLDSNVFLMSPLLDVDTLHRYAEDFQLVGILGVVNGDLQWVVAPRSTTRPHESDAVQRGSVTLLTSGTTGKPKAVRHTWATLLRPVRRASHYAGTRWLLPYPMHLYAGMQVFLQCCANGGSLVPVSSDLSPSEIGAFIEQYRVQYASATPSFWRKLLLFTPKKVLQALPLVQITLGGEATTEELIGSLKKVFPRARIAHIYATSELGRCFTVTDGHAGFPAQYLESPPEPGVQLRIIEGELQVRSENAMKAYDPLSGLQVDMHQWFSTGDLVHVEAGRVHFSGRLTDLINVGGNKVAPLDVERVIREVPEVADVRVYPVPSSVVGEVVGADVVAGTGVSKDELQAKVVALCLQKLQPFQRPRVWKFVDRLATTESGKIRRRELEK